MQLSDRIGYLLAVGNIIVLLLYIPRTFCQYLPSDADNFHFSINQREIFYDNGLIPESKLVPVYIYKDKPENYFFRVEPKSLTFKLVLTPCSATIAWTIKRRNILPDEEELGEEGEYENINDPDPFHAQRSKNQNPLSPYTFLGNFTGKEPTSYFQRRAIPGLYMIQIVALTSATCVKLYATTASYPDNLTPSLPNDKSVSLTSQNKRMFSVGWQKSHFDGGFENSVEYCVAVNSVKNYKTYCDLMSQVLKEKQVSPSGFGFSWEKQRNGKSSSRNGGKSKKDKIHYECVGSKTNYTFKKVKPGKPYFVDVFVLNRKVNTEAAYSGTSVKPSKRDKTPNRVMLKNGKRKTIKLRKGTTQIVSFRVANRLDSAVLELMSCRSKIPIVLYDGTKAIHQTVVRRKKILRMKNLPAGSYNVKLSESRNRTRLVSVLFTTARYRKPKMPRDLKIKVINSASTCNSVTLSWSTTRVKQRYCLYSREATSISNARRHHCLQVAGRRKKDKVVCVRLKRKDRDKKTMQHTVTGLKPKTKYVFDVYVNRGKGASLSYHSIITQTKSDCSK